MYSCKYCSAEFETKNKLGGHISHCAANPKNTEVHTCEFCGEYLVSRKSYTQHVAHCMKNPNRKEYNRIIKVEDITPGTCSYCGRVCKNANSLRNHERLCKLNPNKQITEPHKKGGWPKGKTGWSKGLTKDTDPRLANCSKKVNEYFSCHDGTFKGKHHREDTRSQLSNYAKENDFASHFGSSKRITYNGEHFQSSYEVTVAQSLDAHEIKWAKPKRLKYVDPTGKFHYYTADLYLIDYDVYLDPKNDFLIENVNPHLGYKDTDKIQWVATQNNVKIFVLNKDQLTWPAIKQLIEQSGG